MPVDDWEAFVWPSGDADADASPDAKQRRTHTETMVEVSAGEGEAVGPGPIQAAAFVDIIEGSNKAALLGSLRGGPSDRISVYIDQCGPPQMGELARSQILRGAGMGKLVKMLAKNVGRAKDGGPKSFVSRLFKGGGEE